MAAGRAALPPANSKDNVSGLRGGGGVERTIDGGMLQVWSQRCSADGASGSRDACHEMQRAA